jgi:hypothetical protein
MTLNLSFPSPGCKQMIENNTIKDMRECLMLTSSLDCAAPVRFPGKFSSKQCSKLRDQASTKILPCGECQLRPQWSRQVPSREVSLWWSFPGELRVRGKICQRRIVFWRETGRWIILIHGGAARELRDSRWTYWRKSQLCG